MDVLTVVMLAIVIIAVLKRFTLTLVFTFKCHCTSILSVSALLVDRRFSIIILRNEKSMPNVGTFSLSATITEILLLTSFKSFMVEEMNILIGKPTSY
jgi:hypothetical protein